MSKFLLNEPLEIKGGLSLSKSSCLICPSMVKTVSRNLSSLGTSKTLRLSTIRSVNTILYFFKKSTDLSVGARLDPNPEVLVVCLIGREIVWANVIFTVFPSIILKYLKIIFSLNGFLPVDYVIG
jgi:hypothetical protein